MTVCDVSEGAHSGSRTGSTGGVLLPPSAAAAWLLGLTGVTGVLFPCSASINRLQSAAELRRKAAPLFSGTV